MASSKQDLDRLNFPYGSRRLAKNKATLKGFDIDIHNRGTEASSRTSEQGGIYIVVPHRRNIKHSGHLEPKSTLSGTIHTSPSKDSSTLLFISR